MKTVNKEPLVSVIMPIYNGSKYMAEAIDSILNQTYKKFELIIVNDNSSDSTFEILKSYKKRFPKIKIINLTSKHGPYKAINLALKSAKGDFIAPMDCDDISHPQRLEKEVDFLLRNKNVIVVGTHARIINSQGNVVGKKTFATEDKKIRRQFFEWHPFVHPSTMIRRSLLPDRNNLYYPKFGINSDYYTFFKLFEYGKLANIGEFLFNYRIHFDNNSLKNPKEKFFNSVKIRLYAVAKLGYKPNLFSLIKLFAQLTAVTIIPEKKLVSIYLMSKRNFGVKEAISAFFKRRSISFKKVPSVSPAN
jgi:glycosyltransferase involved in cell wall biosynthesis